MNKLSVPSLLLSVLLLASVSHAEPSAADRTTARRLAHEGQTALDANDFDKAADRFARADALVHAPTLMLGLARARLGQGKLVEAHELLQRILREGAAPGSPPVFFEAIEEAEKLVGPLEKRLSWVTLRVSGPETASVTIDGAPVPAASLGVPRSVNPGTRQIRAEAEGYLPASRELRLAEGERTDVALTLTPAPPTTTSPALEPAERTPAKFDVGADTPAGESQRTWGYAALGIGGAGLVVGTVAGVIALGKHSDLESACPEGRCPESERDSVDSYRTTGAISTVGFIVGAVGVGAGVTLILTAPDSAQAAWRARVGVGGATLEGSF